jgi:acyl-CoA thioesterase
MSEPDGSDGFERDTRVRPDGDTLVADLPARYRTPWGSVAGGFGAGVAVRAAVDTAADDTAADDRAVPRLPASAAVQFLRPLRPGGARLHLEPLIRGRLAEAVRVRMTQADEDDEDVLVATVWLHQTDAESDLGVGPEHRMAPAPDLADPDSMTPVGELLARDGVPGIPLHEVVDIRPRTWMSQQNLRPRPPEESGWLRVVPAPRLDDPGLTAAAALLLLDVTVTTPIWHPLGKTPLDSGFGPLSLDLNVQFFDLAPGDPWLRHETAAPVAVRGLVSGRAALWSRAGEPVAYGISQMMWRPIPALLSEQMSPSRRDPRKEPGSASGYGEARR